MNKFRKSKKQTLKVPVTFSLIILAMGYFWLNTKTTSPPKALQKLQKESLDKGEKESLISIAKQDVDLKDWALISQARKLIEEKKFSEAEKILSSVAEDSAAGVEAKLLTLICGFNLDKSLDGKVIAKTKELLISSERKDLLPSYFLLSAQTARKNNHIETAFHTFLQIREDYPGSPEAKIAKNEIREFKSSDSLDFDYETLPWKKKEVELLIKSKEFEDALDIVDASLAKTIAKSPASLEFLALKERVLRGLGKGKEADETLLVLSADGEKGIADGAMLEIARRAWNINDHHRALDFLEKLKERFPKSDFLEQALYVEARVLEEMKLFVEAKEVYEKLVQSKQESEFKSKALKKLAWLYLRSDNNEKAAKYFGLLKNETKDSASSGAEYWEASVKSDLSVEKLDANYQDYYSAAFNPEKTKLDLKNKLNQSATCTKEPDKQLVSKLEKLNSADISHLAFYEIAYAFRQAKETQELVNKAQLLSKYGNPEKGIRTALRLLRSEGQLLCEEELIKLAYPMPFLSDYKAAAKQSGVDLSLLYAISRTESHFNPQAESIAGAKGLMQLMPATAKKEGWKAKEESLFSPKVNIRLGSKHLDRLLNFYDDEVYAIAAYNAGGSAVNRWMTRDPELKPLEWVEMIGYPETQNYVKKVKTAQLVYLELLSSQND